jgi:hypothetical protein
MGRKINTLSTKCKTCFEVLNDSGEIKGNSINLTFMNPCIGDTGDITVHR